MTEYQKDNAYQAYRLLQIVFVVAPILMGIDKFLYLLTDWRMYLSPFVANIIRDHRVVFSIVGIIEILAGIGVAWKPKIFAYLVALWLLLIIVNLLTLGRFYDVALRDFGLLLAALALGRLSHLYDRESSDRKVRRP